MVAQDYLVQVEALASDNVWAVGFTITSDFAHYDTLILHWDGLAWSIVPSPNTSHPCNTLTGIFAVGPNDIWAVGYSGLPDSAGGSQALALHWDGGSWTVVSTAQPSTGNYLLGVVALSNANVGRWEATRWLIRRFRSIGLALLGRRFPCRGQGRRRL